MRYFLCFFCLFLLLSASPLAKQAGAGEPPVEAFRIGVSEAAFAGLNVNDTSAALKAWTAALARQQNLDVKMELMVYPQFKDLQRDLGKNLLDAVNLNTEEFMSLALTPDHVYLPANQESAFTRYGVVVHEDSGVENLRHLLGRKLVTCTGSHMTLIQPWLQTVYAQENQGRISPGLNVLLADASRVADPSRAIFEVFFQQAQGAIVSLDVFDTACVLNPQLRKKLRIIYQSPPLIVEMFLFNPAYQSPARRKLESVLDNIDSTTKGKQVLTLFRCSRLLKAPVATLKSTTDLLDRYQQLLRQNTIREGS